MRISDLKDRRVALWGMGREGRSTLKTINKALPDLSISILEDHEGKQVSLKDLLNFDLIVLSPGISIYKDAIQEAKSMGVKFTSHTNLWFGENKGAFTICVSGTKGKSTTSSLIHHFLNSLGKRAVLGGNIGNPLFEIQTDGIEYFVIELSSYQIAELDASPSIALLLNLYPEHLDWHKSKEQYFKDKTRLINLNPNGLTILNAADELSIKFIPPTSNQKYFGIPDAIHARDKDIYDGSRFLFNTSSLKLLGIHNLSNLCAALSVIKGLNLDVSSCGKYLSSFKPLPHRMSVICEKLGLTFINDSISTIPEAALAALDSLNSDNVTMLLGGFDRGRDWEEFATGLIKRKILNVITMGPSGKSIAHALNNLKKREGLEMPLVHEAENLKKAVEIAIFTTRSPGIILLSPASPSYGEFKNFEERGDLFTEYALYLLNTL